MIKEKDSQSMFQAGYACGYERGYTDAKKAIREGLEKLTSELSTNEFNSAIMHDFYKNVRIVISGEKIEEE